MFHCYCIPDCSSTSNRERHLSFLAHSLKNKTLLKWVYVIRRINLPLNRHPWICKANILSTQRADVCTLYLDEVQPLYLARPFISSSNKRRKPARYPSASLGNEPVTIVVTTVRLWSKRPSTCVFPEVLEIVSPSTPISPGLLRHQAGGSRPKRKGEVGDPRKAMQGPQGKRRWTDAQSRHERTVL